MKSEKYLISQYFEECMLRQQGINESEGTFSRFQSEMARIRLEIFSRIEDFEQRIIEKKAKDSMGRELKEVLQRFEQLRHSEFGWQDIHGMDEELVVRAERILENQGR